MIPINSPVEPITFQAIYQERVWGGRELERHYGRSLPDPKSPIGESWEIVDRDEAQSIVTSGPLKGQSLHQLWTEQREEIFGSGYDNHRRFPLLIKILDARDDLSIQVHPPAHLAKKLGGEAKTEMWFIADCEPGATLYVGLKQGVTRDTLEKAIQDGSVSDCVHTITPKPGDSIFVPSGRLHAIGAGFLIYEIQQSSNTTFRVFDWNRTGLDGKPRELHVDESLASIDFDDIEPTMDTPDGDTLASCAYFKTDRIALNNGDSLTNPNPDYFSILSVVNGSLESESGHHYQKGDFVLLPKNTTPVTATADTSVLQITLPVC